MEAASIINKYQNMKVSKHYDTIIYMSYLQEILEYQEKHPEHNDKQLLEATGIPRATYYRYKKANFTNIKVKKVSKPKERIIVNGIDLYKLDEQQKINYIEALYFEALELARKQKNAKELRETAKALVSLHGLSPLTKQKMELTQININQLAQIQKADEVLVPELTILDKPLENIKRHKADDNDND